MTTVTKAQIEHILATDQDPYLAQDLISAGAVKHIAIDNDKLNIQLELGFPNARYVAALKDRLIEKLLQQDGVSQIEIDVQTTILAHGVQKNLQPLPNIKNIIAVASGKGGVGKSTTAANLALALHADGAQTGLLDADIYGPSQTRMLGMQGQPTSPDNKHMEPLRPHGIQAMSIGLLVDEEAPMIWRGPMVTRALQQLLQETLWQNLDYLIIDLPPGTGDIQLTLAQQIPVSGAVIVTTPQDIALLDARKALKMFEKVAVPVLGIIENMSMHICSQCGHVESIFGSGGGQQMAQDYQAPLLGALPLDISIREQADGGAPSVVSDPTSKIAQEYIDIARKMTAKLSLLGKDYAARFPNIVVEPK